LDPQAVGAPYRVLVHGVQSSVWYRRESTAPAQDNESATKTKSQNVAPAVSCPSRYDKINHGAE
jgi:hypothetical protein